MILEQGRPADCGGRLEKEIRVYDLLDSDTFGCHPCINTSSLRIRTEDLMTKIIPAMGHEPTIVELDRQVL